MFFSSSSSSIKGQINSTLASSSSSTTSNAASSSSTPQLSPSVVVIIVLITVVFFLSGFLHLLARCFARPSSSTNNGLSRRNNSSGSLNSFQGQLQHLFHLHDSGVEQAFIDALPVFLYRAVRGLKDGADCAVCLNEFSGDDRLRLLPKCSHAFHIECIDTWLLSHSTCPLCRCSLVPDTGSSSSGCTGGAVLGGIRVESFGASSIATSGASFGADSSTAEAATAMDLQILQDDLQLQNQQQQQQQQQIDASRVLPVKLGRFCPANAIGANDPGDSSAALSSRRSYSMGSYEYVLDSSSTGEPQQVAVVFITPTPIHKKWKPRGTPGHRAALSECTMPPERGYSPGGNGSPWVTIDIDARPMLPAAPQTQTQTQTQTQQPRAASSLMSWAPWRRVSRAGSAAGSTVSTDKAKSFSFRLGEVVTHGDEEQPAVWWWKSHHHRGSSRGSVVDAAGGNHAAPQQQWEQASVCSTNAEMKSTGSAASSSVSIARRTLQWLMGRDKQHHQHSRSSVDEIVH